MISFIMFFRYAFFRVWILFVCALYILCAWFFYIGEAHQALDFLVLAIVADLKDDF